jgi:hypothetical protein
MRMENYSYMTLTETYSDGTWSIDNGIDGLGRGQHGTPLVGGMVI